jgi:O-glycosyl hydrolase
MKAYRLALAAAVLVALAAAAGASALTVTVDENTQYQTIEGWGACAGMEPLTTDARARDAYRELGCNLLRIAVEPCLLMAPGGNLEGPEVALGADLDANAALFNWEHDRTDHWDNVAQWLVANALEPARVKLVVSPWSVPHWAKAPTGAKITQGRWRGVTPLIMYCDTCDTAGGTWDTGIYQQDRYQYCARFEAAACRSFELHAGVTLYGLSIQNEVAFENPFNSCTLYHQARAQKVESDTVMDYTVYANALKAIKGEWALNPELDHIVVMGPHHAGLDENPGNPWGHLFQMEGIAAVKNHSDPNLINFLDTYTHNYGAPPAKRAEMFRAYWEGIDSMPDETWAEWTYPGPGIMNDGKQTWNSEFGGHETDWAGALNLASDLHTQLVWGNESAIIHWSFVEDSHTVHNLLATSHLDDPTQSKKYSAFKQFSRYVRPGAVRVSAVFDDGSTSYGTGDDMDTEAALNVSAYVHDVDGRVTVVLVNMQTQSHAVDVVPPASPAVSAFDAYRTSSSEGLAYLGSYPVSGGVVSVTVPAESVVTLTGGSQVPPVANDDQYSVPKDATLIVSAPGVLANDSDGNNDPLTAIKVSNPPHGSVVLNSDGSFEYTPDAGYMGSDSFTYKANDGTADSNVATVHITVTEPTCHVESIDMYFTKIGNIYYYTADVLIVNSYGTPLEGATVTGTFHKWDYETHSAATGPDGVATLTSTDAHSRNGRATGDTTFCVDNVTHQDYLYDEDDNVETCDVL